MLFLLLDYLASAGGDRTPGLIARKIPLSRMRLRTFWSCGALFFLGCVLSPNQGSSRCQVATQAFGEQVQAGGVVQLAGLDADEGEFRRALGRRH